MRFLKNSFGSKKEQAIGSYADFWAWFRQQEKHFHKAVKEGNNIEADFFDHLTPALTQLNEGFFFVTGMMDEQTAELVFTADGKIANLVFIEELVDAAPALAGWKFTAHKQPLDISDVEISLSGNVFNTNNLSFYSTEHPTYPDEIDITLVHTDYTEANKDNIFNGSYIFLDNLLGELNSVSIIDTLNVSEPPAGGRELIPIEKLDAFLTWRQKEFIEKYNDTRYDTENDSYSIMEAELEDGKGLIAVINTDLLQWDAKASHPWLATVEIKYDGTPNNGMPDKATYQLLDDIENDILKELKDAEGYLNIGRQTSNSVREIYLACKEFRNPSKVLADVVSSYQGQLEISFDIYKDKYWVSLSRFNKRWD